MITLTQTTCEVNSGKPCYQTHYLGQYLVAKKANVSESTLYRYFKKELKITPNQYLWDIKLNHAKKLLRENKELNISQIGYNVGIQNPFYFSKIFKQHIGVSPKQYRESILEKV